MTHSHIPLAGVIGDPIAHSLSPRMHGHWLKSNDIAGYYIPLHITPDNFERAVRMMPDMGFVGANVTIPHKAAALAIADEVTDRARKIGASNTLVFRRDGRILADNTDAYGFMANLKQGAPDWDPTTGPAVVMGAGGASRAIIVALLDADTPQIVLSNRTRTTADALCEEFGNRITVIDWDHTPKAFLDATTVVNTTSLGMTGQPPLPFDLDSLQSGTLVTDIVYAPLKTPLLATAKQAGCMTVDGLGMLLHQGVPGFEYWFGIRPEVDDTLRQIMLA